MKIWKTKPNGTICFKQGNWLYITFFTNNNENTLSIRIFKFYKVFNFCTEGWEPKCAGYGTWWINGKCHRDGDPAVQIKNGEQI